MQGEPEALPLLPDRHRDPKPITVTVKNLIHLITTIKIRETPDSATISAAVLTDWEEMLHRVSKDLKPEAKPIIIIVKLIQVADSLSLPR